jgi:hypothetical protein
MPLLPPNLSTPPKFANSQLVRYVLLSRCHTACRLLVPYIDPADMALSSYDPATDIALKKEVELFLQQSESLPDERLRPVYFLAAIRTYKDPVTCQLFFQYMCRSTLHTVDQTMGFLSRILRQEAVPGIPVLELVSALADSVNSIQDFSVAWSSIGKSYSLGKCFLAGMGDRLTEVLGRGLATFLQKNHIRIIGDTAGIRTPEKINKRYSAELKGLDCALGEGPDCTDILEVIGFDYWLEASRAFIVLDRLEEPLVRLAVERRDVAACRLFLPYIHPGHSELKAAVKGCIPLESENNDAKITDGMLSSIWFASAVLAYQLVFDAVLKYSDYQIQSVNSRLLLRRLPGVHRKHSSAALKMIRRLPYHIKNAEDFVSVWESLRAEYPLVNALLDKMGAKRLGNIFTPDFAMLLMLVYQQGSDGETVVSRDKLLDDQVSDEALRILCQPIDAAERALSIQQKNVLLRISVEIMPEVWEAYHCRFQEPGVVSVSLKLATHTFNYRAGLRKVEKLKAEIEAMPGGSDALAAGMFGASKSKAVDPSGQSLVSCAQLSG